MVESTEHKVKSAGKSIDVSVEHTSCKAYQFDFYVPKNIWKLRVVKKFFDALSAHGGATVFDDEVGMWKDKQETTQVFRLVVCEGDPAIRSVRKMLRREIGQLMATLWKTRHDQEAMMYTETLIQRYMGGKLKRADQNKW